MASQFGPSRRSVFPLERESEGSVEPEIYFDEKETPPENSGKERSSSFCTRSNALFLLDGMEKLLSLVHTGKELKVVRMRLKGMNYREIAFHLHMGLASINRLVRRIALRNPEVGFLLENARDLREEREP